jgi:AraC-like DNA-binding protein
MGGARKLSPRSPGGPGGQTLPPVRNRAAWRAQFLAEVGLLEAFQQVFEQLPEVFFFVKNERSQLICASGLMLRRFNLASDLEVVGTTDYDYFPRYIADGFVRDDQWVMHQRKPLLNHVEISYNEQRVLDWFVTNKFPLADKAGRIVGVIGTVQSYEQKRDAHLPFANISRAVDYVRSNLHERISVDSLAKLTGVSPRQLHRKFRQAFGLSVQDFLTKTRVQAAGDALVRTSRPIAEIAVATGFCDQSAFTHQFHKTTGLTPLKFRRHYSAPPAE